MGVAMTIDRLRTATVIKECCQYLLDDANRAELNLVGLHLQLAIMEADEVLDAEHQADAEATVEAATSAPPRLARGKG